MAVQPVTHPSADDLRAFGLGKLDDTSAALVMSHLQACPHCCQEVASLSGDSFLDRFREGQSPSATPAPLQGLSTLAPASKDRTPVTGPDVLPPDLANHPQYKLLRELGRGGMGIVYQAEHRLMERPVAIKVINKHRLDRPEALDRFHREVKAAARLTHPNIVTAYHAEQAGDLLLLVMEYVEGTSLADVVSRRGKLPVLHACSYVRQVALGLQHAFEQGMVHRDIKPHNLMLTPKGRIKILDFGLARLASEQAGGLELTAENAVMGTPTYMAPEQGTDARQADIRADIYSLGCTLYCLLSGEPPFAGGSAMHVIFAHKNLEAKPLHEVRPDVPPELAAVVVRMMAKDPAQRYQEPAQVAKALTPFCKPGSKVEHGVKPDRALLDEPTLEVTSTGGTREALAIRTRLPSVFEAAKRNWRMVAAAIAIGLLLVGLVGLLDSGVFRVKTKDGTIVLEDLPDNSEVLVNDNVVTLKTSDGKTFEFSIVPGKTHVMRIRKSGFTAFVKEIQIDAGGRLPITVSLEPLPTVPIQRPVAATDDKGFVPVFNGKDLTGWIVDSGDTNAWQVKDGELICQGVDKHDTGIRGYLLSERDYGDCVIRFLFKQVDRKDATSGIAFRAVPGETEGPPGPQSPSRPFHLTAWLGQHPTAGRATNGTLNLSATGEYKQRYLPPEQIADLKEVGQWNAVELELRGQSLRMTMNGVEVQKTTLVQHAPPLHPAPGLDRHTGRIGFMKLTGAVRFRDIRVRELPADEPVAPAALRPGDRDSGFEPLVNGKDLTGWIVDSGDPQAWQVHDGELIARGTEEDDPSRRGYLLTERDYADYVLRFQVKQATREDATSALAFRAVPGETRSTSMVGGTNDAWHLMAHLGNGAKSTGALILSPDALVEHSFIFPDQLPDLKNVGEWNSVELELRGQLLRMSINGREVQNVMLNRSKPQKSPAIGLNRYSGRIGFQKRTSEVRFRNVEIKELLPAPANGLARPNQ